MQLTGRWYSIGLASNSNWFKEKRHLMEMCTTKISSTADGNLEVTSTYPKYGAWDGVSGEGVLGVASGASPAVVLPRGDQCVTRNSLYVKTEQPGRFTYTNPRECPAPRLQPWTRSQPCCPCSCLGAAVELQAEPCPMSPAGWGSQHSIRVVDTNYEEYALVATQISKGTGSSTMVLLYSTSALGPPCCPAPEMSVLLTAEGQG